MDKGRTQTNGPKDKEIDDKVREADYTNQEKKEEEDLPALKIT